MLKRLKNYLQDFAFHLPDRSLFDLSLTPWPALIVFICISLVLAGRTLGTAPDDISYINYFKGSRTVVSTTWMSYALNEILWSPYATLLGRYFDGETAYRITIFVSAFIFLFASSILSRGAWVFISLVFLIDVMFATQMYYNQIRQGVALSAFFMMIVIGLSYFLASIVTIGLHTGFIVVIPCTLAATLFKRSNILLITAILAIVLCIGVFKINYIQDNIDMLKRISRYATTGKLNTYFYMFAVIQYGLIFVLLLDKNPDDQQKFWFNFSFFFFAATMVISFINEAGGRLFYFLNGFVMILIGLNLKRLQGKISALVWLIFLIGIGLNESSKGGFGPDTWVGRWLLILTG